MKFRYDEDTGFCAGPDDQVLMPSYPEPLVNACIRHGGGENTCRGTLWNRTFTIQLLESLDE